VAIPTETVYGLAGNALNEIAVAKIFAIKNRPSFDPLIIHVPDADAVRKYTTEFPEALQKLAATFWPGPLTLLLPKKDIIPDLVTSGLPRVAIRIPGHPLAKELLKSIDFPLAAPSANPFGYISPTSAKHVSDQLSGKIPYILDGGECRVGLESTIVGWEDGEVVIYRLGGIEVEEIRKLAGNVKIFLNQSSNPNAPGMLKSHYAPRKPLYLNHLEENIQKFAGKKIGLICMDEVPVSEQVFRTVYLSKTGDMQEAARNLFAALRTLDQSEVDIILAAPAPEEGLGRAINDRLRRAAVPAN